MAGQQRVRLRSRRTGSKTWVLFAPSLNNCSCWTGKIGLPSHLFKWAWPVAFEILALRGALQVFILTIDGTKSPHCYTACLIDIEVDFSPQPTFPSPIHLQIDSQIPIQKTISLAEFSSQEIRSSAHSDNLSPGNPAALMFTYTLSRNSWRKQELC